ncbi:MAG: prealbumin-like fold domain-containing protein, partial [Chloroflexota bacterium]|nr:prealbumin-like fold domain-containing protein [Chloroflexota bacterium]
MRSSVRTRLALAVGLALVGGVLAVAPVAADHGDGSATVYKFDAETDEPLANACFVIVPEGDEGPHGNEQCTDTSGSTTFEGLAPGNYDLSETSPPEGYEFIDGPIRVTVTEQEPDPVVDVPNQRRTPMGFLQLNKYDCTEVEEASITVYDPAPEEPPEPDEPVGTCGITPGAVFQITGDRLAEPMYLTTNIFGQAQAEFETGDYEIRELSPNQVGPEGFTVDDQDFIFVLAVNPFDVPPG